MQNTSTRLALGLISILPLLSLLAIRFNQPVFSASSSAPQLAFGIVLLFGIVMLLALALIVYFLVWLVKNPAFSTIHKTTWVLLLSMAGVLTLPIFWLRYFRPGLDSGAFT